MSVQRQCQTFTNRREQIEREYELAKLIVDDARNSGLIAFTPVHVEYSQFGGCRSMSVSVQEPNSTKTALPTPPEAMILARKLHDGMFQKDKGTWFSMKILVNETFNLYEYDKRPDFGETMQILDHDYTMEFNAFPRDHDYLPKWYQDALERLHHAQEEAEYVDLSARFPCVDCFHENDRGGRKRREPRSG